VEPGRRLKAHGVSGPDPLVIRLAVALAIGILSGIERERSKPDAAAISKTVVAFSLGDRRFMVPNL
jgi:hypothetical protein